MLERKEAMRSKTINSQNMWKTKCQTVLSCASLLASLWFPHILKKIKNTSFLHSWAVRRIPFLTRMLYSDIIKTPYNLHAMFRFRYSVHKMQSLRIHYKIEMVSFLSHLSHFNLSVNPKLAGFLTVLMDVTSINFLRIFHNITKSLIWR